MEIEAYDCKTAADVMAHAAAVRERRKAVFFVPQAPRITPPRQQIEPAKPVVVPEVVEEIRLADHFSPPDQEPGERLPSLEDIKIAVCHFYRVRGIDLLSARRTKDVVGPRQVAMWFGRKTTLKSFPAIGQYFGGRDHSTAVHAFDRIERRIADCEPVIGHILSIAEILRGKGLTVDLGIGAGE